MRTTPTRIIDYWFDTSTRACACVPLHGAIRMVCAGLLGRAPHLRTGGWVHTRYSDAGENAGRASPASPCGAGACASRAIARTRSCCIGFCGFLVYFSGCRAGGMLLYAVHALWLQASDAAHLPNERIRLRNLLMAPRVLSLLFKELAAMERVPLSGAS